ncbi:MAG TPA: hypothetical protein VE081_04045 [Sporichthyaceae bacterium]|nr:hypothetical protein [Sporichthyaceae bacterium]
MHRINRTVVVAAVACLAAPALAGTASAVEAAPGTHAVAHKHPTHPKGKKAKAKAKKAAPAGGQANQAPGGTTPGGSGSPSGGGTSPGGGSTPPGGGSTSPGGGTGPKQSPTMINLPG